MLGTGADEDPATILFIAVSDAFSQTAELAQTLQSDAGERNACAP